MDRDMRESDEVRIKYASKHARVSNYHKKWIGENRGLKRLKAIETKREFELKFATWANISPQSGARKKEYGEVLKEFKEVYSQLNDLQLAQDYLYEAGFAMEIVSLAYRFEVLVNLAKEDSIDEAKWGKGIIGLKKRVVKHFKDYNLATDKSITPVMLEMYEKGLPADYKPAIFKIIESKYKGDYKKYSDYVFTKSIFSKGEKLTEFMSDISTKTILKIEKDPAYKLMIDILSTYREKVAIKKTELDNKVDLLNRTYLKGIIEMNQDKKYAPDANSTLRLAYGKVDDYLPKDGAEYAHYTTLKGIMEKADQTDIEDYKIPSKLRKLYDSKDFGQYADSSGYMPVCFIASNHTTGGNSGSPVIDANGNLIGLNFDRNWEGTMSDIMYDPDRCRNISVDARYVLFVVDKFAGAGHLVKEMTLVK